MFLRSGGFACDLRYLLDLFFTMKLVALGVAIVLLLTCNGFGGHAAPHVTSLYKSAGAALQQKPSVGDIWKDCSEF